MDELLGHLLRFGFWAVVCGVLGVFVLPHPFWVFLGIFGAALVVVLFVWWAFHFRLDDWLADVIRRSRRR